MTVQQLIDELIKIEDKSKRVVIKTAENWGYETISYTDETIDSVDIWRTDDF